MPAENIMLIKLYAKEILTSATSAIWKLHYLLTNLKTDSLVLSNLEEHFTIFQSQLEELVSEFITKPSIINQMPKKKQKELEKILSCVPDDLYEFTSSSLFTRSLANLMPLGKEMVVNKSPVNQDSNIGIENQSRLQQMINAGNPGNDNVVFNVVPNRGNNIQQNQDRINPVQNMNPMNNIQMNPSPNQHITCHFYPILTSSISVPISEDNIISLREQNPAILHLPLNANLRHIKNSILRPILNCLPLGSVPMGLKRGRMQIHFLGINSDQWTDWLSRFMEALADRNNVEEIVAQQPARVEQLVEEDGEIEEGGIRGGMELVADQNIIQENGPVNQHQDGGANNLADQPNAQLPIRIESMVVNGTTDMWNMTRGLVRNGSVFIVECKQGEPGFLLQGMIN